MHRFALGGYLLQKTKEDVAKYIKKKRRIFANVKGKVVELVILVLGRLSTDFRKLKICSKLSLPQFVVREF